jgi:hypothetical protein
MLMAQQMGCGGDEDQLAGHYPQSDVNGVRLGLSSGQAVRCLRRDAGRRQRLRLTPPRRHRGRAHGGLPRTREVLLAQ